MFNKKPKIIIDEQIIDEILNRGISKIYPTKDRFKEKLLSGERLRIYFGADATGSNLHLGHSIHLILVEKLRQLGHEMIILFGDFTAKIGDPTDKSATRIMLTDDEIKNNLKNWQEQVEKIVKIKDKKNPVKIVRNSEWLSKMTFEDVIKLSSNFTVQQMIERDMFQKRLKESKPIYLHEFFYPLMQGYDSVHLNVDVEIGGTDQTFNMLAGRTLLSKIKNKEKFVVSISLLEDSKTGKKLMSKSEGNAIYLNDSAGEMFGKTMSLNDEAIVPMLIGTTKVSLEKIKEIESDLLKGKNPRDSKMFLAKEIVKIYYGEKGAEKAEQNFIETFRKKNITLEETNLIEVKKGDLLSEILISNSLVGSKSEWRRLIDGGAIKNLKDELKIDNYDYSIEKNLDLKIGKKKFIKLIIIK